MRPIREVLFIIVVLGLCSCVTVEEFDFDNYETSKAKSFIFKEPIVDKPKKDNVVVPERMIAKVQEAKQKRAIQNTSIPKASVQVTTRPVTMKEAVKKAEIIEKKKEASSLKLYTPEIVIDPVAYPVKQAKGAALLVWTKRDQSAEVEIFQESNPEVKNLHKVGTHFFHVMVYFNKKYLWRVRLLNKEGDPVSEYSNLKPLQVVRKNRRALSSPPQ